MHGLETINELNNLAAQNAPGAPEAAISAADAKRAGRTSQFDCDIAEAIASNNLRRLEELHGLHPVDLVARVQQSELPTLLEIALANKVLYLYNLLAERPAPNEVNGSNLPELATAGQYPHQPLAPCRNLAGIENAGSLSGD